jgi:O-succinylhomoserine sulfhydrylase
MTEGEPGYAFDTWAVRGGQQRTGEGEQAEPIFATSSYVFLSAAQAAARFSGAEPGNIYSRFTNPTVRTFEQRLAGLEGGERCVATSSGMAAILATCMALLKAGDHIVASRSIFGTTVVLFSTYLRRFDVETSFVPLTDLCAWEQAAPARAYCSSRRPQSADRGGGYTGTTELPCPCLHMLLVVDNCLCTLPYSSRSSWRGTRDPFRHQVSGWAGRWGWWWDRPLMNEVYD